jgi:hypothetical protein
MLVAKDNARKQGSGTHLSSPACRMPGGKLAAAFAMTMALLIAASRVLGSGAQHVHPSAVERLA